MYDSGERAFFPIPEGHDGSETHDGVVWAVRYVILCGSNDPDQPQNELCVEATCESGGALGYDTQVFRRETSSDPWEPWPGRERICRTVTEGDPIPLVDVEDEILAILEEHYEAVARPSVDIDPSANALVNLPVIASTEDVGSLAFEIDNPLPGRVDIDPSYAWRWSDGSGGEGAGRGYDGTDPVSRPEHYPVQATYAGSGDHHVALTATWTVTLVVEGIPPIADIEPLVYEAAETFTVRSARTVLVD